MRRKIIKENREIITKNQFIPSHKTDAELYFDIAEYEYKLAANERNSGNNEAADKSSANAQLNQLKSAQCLLKSLTIDRLVFNDNF